VGAILATRKRIGLTKFGGLIPPPLQAARIERLIKIVVTKRNYVSDALSRVRVRF
jgi:hypothetical protein